MRRAGCFGGPPFFFCLVAAFWPFCLPFYLPASLPSCVPAFFPPASLPASLPSRSFDTDCLLCQHLNSMTLTDGDARGEFEQVVLLAALRLGDGAYAVTIRDDIRQ